MLARGHFLCWLLLGGAWHGNAVAALCPVAVFDQRTVFLSAPAKKLVGDGKICPAAEVPGSTFHYGFGLSVGRLRATDRVAAPISTCRTLDRLASRTSGLTQASVSSNALWSTMAWPGEAPFAYFLCRLWHAIPNLTVLSGKEAASKRTRRPRSQL